VLAWLRMAAVSSRRAKAHRFGHSSPRTEQGALLEPGGVVSIVVANAIRRDLLVALRLQRQHRRRTFLVQGIVA
jgi:hypothetical protein